MHGVAQRVQPGPDPAFDRAEGDAQDDGDLMVGVAAVEGEHDGLANHGGFYPRGVNGQLHTSG